MTERDGSWRPMTCRNDRPVTTKLHKQYFNIGSVGAERPAVSVCLVLAVSLNPRGQRWQLSEMWTASSATTEVKRNAAAPRWTTEQCIDHDDTERWTDSQSVRRTGCTACICLSVSQECVAQQRACVDGVTHARWTVCGAASKMTMTTNLHYGDLVYMTTTKKNDTLRYRTVAWRQSICSTDRTAWWRHQYVRQCARNNDVVTSNAFCILLSVNCSLVTVYDVVYSLRSLQCMAYSGWID